MAAYKRQHYVPAVYLKNFSVDGKTADRKSNIYRLDATRSLCVPVESQCAEDYFYTSKTPKATEENFQEMEGRYGNILKKVWEWKSASGSAEYYSLILVMADFHIRNLAYVNATGDERIAAYEMMIAHWRDHICGEDNASDVTWGKRLQENWRVLIVTPPKGGDFITSDNPCIWSGPKGKQSLMFLPLTPGQMAVAYNRSIHRISGGAISQNDLDVLNSAQANHCVDAVFSHLPHLPEGEQRIRWIFQNRHSKPGRISFQGWVPNLYVLPEPLSFLATV